MENAWNTDVWIGLSDAKTPCKYTWSDGALVSWTNWAVGYPRGVWSGEHCVFMNLKGATQDMMYWRVGNCSQEKLFMCKKIICKLFLNLIFVFRRIFTSLTAIQPTLKINVFIWFINAGYIKGFQFSNTLIA